ncbi:MAG TPA: MerR family transcriptional regulator [Polyangiaceae bacterium]|jgi:DNA-binding transcriptional MerR regulator|nr:MerR family transcriptional regulator [Polyangiaceae bacterium]
MAELNAVEWSARIAATKTKSRRRRGPAREGWRIADLAQLTGLSPRLITHYVATHLVEAPEFHASDTRYQRVHLLRLLAVRPLKAQGLKIAALRARLNDWGAPGVEEFVRGLPLSDVVRRALGWVEAPKLSPQPDPAVAVIGERWQRVVILPGLELLLRDDARPIVREVAARVLEQFQALS